MTLAWKIDILAAMINIGDLFVDDMGMLLMVVKKPKDIDEVEESYWQCDDVVNGSGKYYWFKDREVKEGKEKLKKALDNPELLK